MKAEKVEKRYTLYGKSRLAKEHGEIIDAIERLCGILFPSFMASGFDPGVHLFISETNCNFVLPLRALLEAAEAANLLIPEVLQEFKQKVR